MPDFIFVILVFLAAAGIFYLIFSGGLTGHGEWLTKEPPTSVHLCSTPSLVRRKAGPGSIWRCKCGQQFRVVHEPNSRRGLSWIREGSTS